MCERFSRARVRKHFFVLVKEKIVNNLKFVATWSQLQLCHYSLKAATDLSKKWSGMCYSIASFPKQQPGQTWPLTIVCQPMLWCHVS